MTERRAPEPSPPLSAKQWLILGAFCAAGLAVTGYGVWALAGFVRASLHARGPMSTESSVFAVPFIGLVLLLVPVLQLSGRLAPGHQERLENRIFAAMLAAAGAVLLLGAGGSPLVDLWMEHSGFVQCGASRGNKVAFKTWTLRGTPCPAESS